MQRRGSLLRRSPEIRKSTRGTRTPPLTVIARSACDEAIQGPRAVAPGLLQCARNDGGVDATIIGHRLSVSTRHHAAPEAGALNKSVTTIVSLTRGVWRPIKTRAGK